MKFPSMDEFVKSCADKALNEYEYEGRTFREWIEILKKHKIGHWIKDVDDSQRWDRIRYYCSECGDWHTYGESKYCPNCGAEMEKADDREDTGTD